MQVILYLEIERKYLLRIINHNELDGDYTGDTCQWSWKN